MAIKSDLILSIKRLIGENQRNVQLKRELRDEFLSKNMNINIPSMIFDLNQGDVEVEELDDMELLAITNVLYNKFRWKTLNPNLYFSDKVREDYIKYYVVEETITELHFKNVEKFKGSDRCYICNCWSLEDIAIAKKFRNLRYNFETQRSPIYKINKADKTKTSYIKKIDLNLNSVKEIAKEFKDGSYFPPDALTLNVPLLKGKKSNFFYNEKTKELIIQINTDIDDINYTVVDVIDGWHRITAAYKIFNDVDFNLERLPNSIMGLPVFINMVTIEEAKKFVVRKSKGNKMGEDFIRANEVDEFSNFIDNLNNIGNKENNILFNNIAVTYNEQDVTKKLTNRISIKKGLKIVEKNSNIDFKSVTDQVIYAETFVKIINMILDTICKKKFDNDRNKLLNSIYVKPNIYIGYFAICNFLKDEDNELEIVKIIQDFVNNLLKNEDNLKNLKLHYKNCDANLIYNSFEQLL